MAVLQGLSLMITLKQQPTFHRKVTFLTLFSGLLLEADEKHQQLANQQEIHQEEHLLLVVPVSPKDEGVTLELSKLKGVQPWFWGYNALYCYIYRGF